MCNICVILFLKITLDNNIITYECNYIVMTTITYYSYITIIYYSNIILVIYRKKG